MPKITYINKNFRAEAKAKIVQANSIISEYQSQGFELTLRQLYYQFVARDLVQNNQKEYKKLGELINDARLAGLIDWNAIVDRTRELRSIGTWENPAEIISGCAEQFRVDVWAEQTYRPEVWIEKDALVGVIEPICTELRIPYFSCRGYTSQSELWAAGRRLQSYDHEGQTPIVLHFGDHDPSGMDMTRDITDRLKLFARLSIEVKRIALNGDQIEQYNPPPNFAKITDSRADKYIAEFGNQSWELDALEPNVIAQLIRDEIELIQDADEWERTLKRENKDRERLKKVSDNWDTLKLR